MKHLIPTVSTAFRRGLLASVIALSPVVIDKSISSFSNDYVGSSSVFAQVKAKNKYAGQEARKHPNVTETFGKRINEAAGFLQPEDESVKPNPQRALQLLTTLEGNAAKQNAYEQVLLHQYKGYAYLALEDYTKALASFNKMLSLSPNMPLSAEANTVRLVGQLYSQIENPRKALEMMIKWTDYAETLKPEDSYLFASLYYQIEDNANALLNINEAVKNQEAAGKVPQESWYILQRGLYFDKEDFKNGLPVLEKLIRHYPKAQYWKQLSQVYRMLNREKEALAALEVCYQMGGLTTERDLVNLSYMYLEAEVPYKAVKVLRKGIYTDKSIEPTAKNLKTLADSLRLSQDVKDSIAEYEKAAQKSTDGELIIGLAQSYLATDNFKNASKWARQALRAGGLKRVDSANLVVAAAELELKNYDEAIKFFEEAAKDARSKDLANRYISHAKSEKERAIKLAQE